MTPLLELDGVTKTYPGPPPVTALRPANLTVYVGQYLAITGRSGSGKSTLLNILGLIDRPTAGTYRIDGLDTAAMSEPTRTALRARRIGLVFQAFHLLPHRSAEENVALGLLYKGRPARMRRDAARTALSRVGLADRTDATPARLSGGEQQRVAIARALVSEPALLLCDEPTGNLDTTTANQILDIIDELHRDGLTVIVITHDPSVGNRAEGSVRITDGVVNACPT
jgi:putative ABC transport system ATP-binding protein